MNLRKEHVVLIGTLGVLGLLYAGSSGGPGLRGSRSGTAPEFVDHPAPSTAVSLPEARRAGDIRRDVFAPPRDTRPLPRLAAEPPPLPALPGLAPPPEPGLDARLYGKLLRADATAESVPGLFVAADTEDLGDLQDETESAPAAEPESRLELGPAERAALIESWKKLYDWIRVDEELLFGQIRNSDRYGITRRAEEGIEFVQVDPETGREKFPGMKPVKYERRRVKELAFADTASNRIQLRRREFLDEHVGASRYAGLLVFADQCVSDRLAAREALGVAEEMYRLAMKSDADDPAPRLGLARCFEAGFRFEQAYSEYEALLEGYGHRPEVHVGLSQLEAKLRLYESAEERFRHAEQIGGRTSWRVEWPFGRFLLEQGRFDEALAHLREAFKYEPTDPSEAHTRAAIRADLGAALLATGALDEAAQSFDKALQAESAMTRALAGKLAAMRLGAKGTRPQAIEGQSAGFDLMLSLALDDLAAKRWTEARDRLLLAASTDPLRAPRAWRALSWLAELAGYPDEALRWVERALEGDPTDAWSLHQQGRLLAQRDDLPGAREAFLRALDQELDFEDALVWLGLSSYTTGDRDAAERYLERALSIDDERPDVHALRGLNQLISGDLTAASTSFGAALRLDSSQPVARAGQAWVSYRSGDSDKAISQFAELGEVRRGKPEDDPYRVYAREMIERIREHDCKFVWSDAFERLQLKNGWETEEAGGPQAALADGALRIEGNFRETATSRVYRTMGATQFVAIEADLTVPSDNNSKVGLFVAKEKTLSGGRQVQVQSKLAVARRRDGVVEVLVMDTATAEENWEVLEPVGGVSWWPADRTVRLRIEKIGEGNEARGRISIDGIPVREGFKVPKLASSTNDVRVGVFVEGQVGLPAKLLVDDVDTVQRVNK